MRFTLSRRTVTASGREIIRAVTRDADRLSIGRDPGGDIALEDLAVLPHHAQIVVEGSRLVVEALGTLGFDHDGRRVMRADIDSATGAELRFGAHRITIAPTRDAEGPVTQIAIERVSAVSHSAGDRDEARAFSLAGLIPGRRLSAWGFALLTLAAFLVAPILAFQGARGLEERAKGFYADQSWSSGPLSSAHHSLSNDCQSCHVEPFVAVTDTACVSCHDDAHDHARPDRLALARSVPDGWRRAQNRIAAAFNRPEGRCVDCHTEHDGAGPMPATAQRFCTDCHGDMNTRLTDTRIANAGDFGTAHPQFRPRVAALPGNPPTFRRATWSPNLRDNSGLIFPHDEHLDRRGGVAQMARRLRLGRALECASCHQPTEDGVRFQPVDMERDCQQCHSLGIETIAGVVRTLRHGEPAQVAADIYALYRSTSPPRPITWNGLARRRPGDFALSNTRRTYSRAVAARPAHADAAVRAVFSRGGACAECHTIAPPIRGNAAWRVTPVFQQSRYMTGGWFDHGPHEQEECSSCHAAGRSDNAADLLIPGLSNCRECHGGEASNSDVPSSCAMCHEYHADPAGGAPWQPDRRRNNRRVTSITDRETQRLYAGR
jgi:predicted CXXCH cytochrome family protein